MQTWMRFGIGLAAIALAIAAGTAAYAMRDDSNEPARQATNDVAPVPAEGAEDTAGGTFAAICAADQPDCDDIIEVPIGDFSESKCAADVVNCIDPSCVTILPTDQGVVESGLVDPPVVDAPPPAPETFPADSPGESVAGAPPALSDEELKRLDQESAHAGEICVEPMPCIPGPADECLPPDCAVSSDGSVACPEPYPCVQMGMPEGGPDGREPLPTEKPCAYASSCPMAPGAEPGAARQHTIDELCGGACGSPPVPDPAVPQDLPATSFPCIIEPCIEILPVEPSTNEPPLRGSQSCVPRPETCAVEPPNTVCILPAPAEGGGTGSSEGSAGVVDPAPAE